MSSLTFVKLFHVINNTMIGDSDWGRGEGAHLDCMSFLLKIILATTCVTWRLGTALIVMEGIENAYQWISDFHELIYKELAAGNLSTK